jgi:hypothetical protein
VPERREQSVDDPHEDRTGQNAKNEKPEDVGGIGEIGELRGSTAQEPGADERFREVEEGQEQTADDAMMANE